LLTDQYLASDWDASMLRRFQTLESICQKIADQVVSRRMEVVERIDRSPFHLPKGSLNQLGFENNDA
jgi:hypothetical protein